MRTSVNEREALPPALESAPAARRMYGPQPVSTGQGGIVIGIPYLTVLSGTLLALGSWGYTNAVQGHGDWFRR